MISKANKAIIDEERIVRKISIPVFYSGQTLAKVVALHVNTMRECAGLFATARVLTSTRWKEAGAGEVT